MNKNTNLLKYGYKFSLTSSFFSLFEALFMVIPIYWLSVVTFSLAKTNNAEGIRAILLTVSLIVITLSKISLSITGLVLGFKTRKQFKINRHNFYNLKLILFLSIINSTLLLLFVLALIIGLEIKYLLFVDIFICLLLATSISLLLTFYFKQRKLNNLIIKENE